MNCLSIAFESVDKCIEATQGFEIVEFRLDKIKFSNKLKDLFSVQAKTIATYRPNKDVNDDERISVLKKAIDEGADYIDIEIENSEAYKEELLEYSCKKGVKVIVSYHDMQKTPPKAELEHLIAWASEYNADIIKIACLVNDKKDAARLLSLYDSDLSLIVIGMGELGKITRVAASIMGAPFMFVSFDKDSQTASGQFSKEEIEDILKRI